MWRPDATKTMRVLALAAIAICLVLYGWTVWYERSLRRSDPFGYRNVKACEKIAPGVTAAGLAAVLGAPERTEEAGGVRRLFFHTLSEASAPIRADVDAASGRVLGLNCRDDGTPMWTLPR